MDPNSLIGPPSPLGYPAPFWFITFFKVLGFTLHAFPMNLWYAGLLVSLILGWRGGEPGRTMSRRLISQLPIIVAAGVNLGIVPLLFVQVAYHQVFYPATILMAWPWLSIVGLLMFAYYGIYCYVSSLKKHGDDMPFSRRIVGWLSAGCFIAIGFVFANAFSLMANVEAWGGIYDKTEVGGAVLGTGLNALDPSLWPRWLMMFGLALTTTAVWFVFDAAWFARKEGREYQSAVASKALAIHTVGMAWFALAGAWYTFGTWPEEVRETMFGPAMMTVTALTAVSPGLSWLLVMFQREGPTRGMGLLAVLAQIGVLGINAISRQAKQLVEVGRHLDVSAGKVITQWSPLILFLLLFVAGVGLVVWMVRKVVEETSESPA